MESTLFSLSAVAALIPASLLAWRREGGRDAVFWLGLGVAVAGPVAWGIAQATGSWPTGFAAALWVSVAATLVTYLAVVLTTRQAWRLARLMLPYMLLVALLAGAWQLASGLAPSHGPPIMDAWVAVHIILSLTTYALVTIAAVAGLAAFLQDRTLKRKQPTAMSRALPALADCERIEVGLLAVGEVVLALGLATGVAVQYRLSGSLLVADHKTVLTIAAFLLIGGLLAAHYLAGVRGRTAARLVLVAYLLLTLGYPGVKFITDVLL